MDKQTNTHELRLVDRSRLELSGVKAVAAFDEDYIALDTSLGKMYIEGTELRILDLSEESGRILVSGTINEISYQQGKEKRRKGLFG